MFYVFSLKIAIFQKAIFSHFSSERHLHFLPPTVGKCSHVISKLEITGLKLINLRIRVRLSPKMPESPLLWFLGKLEVIRQFFICIENTHNTNTKKGFPNFLLALDTVEN